LSIQSNQLERLPDSIGQLKKLSFFDLTKNNLSRLPSRLQEWVSLEKLILHNNQINCLPDSIGSLRNLRVLYLGANKLVNLPDLGNLTNLFELDLSENQLVSLPKGIGKMISLESLDVSGNMITSLHPGIGNLRRLTSLNCRANQLNLLPAELLRLKNLVSVNLNQNPFINLAQAAQLQDLTVYSADAPRLMTISEAKVVLPHVLSLKEMAGRRIIRLQIPFQLPELPPELREFMTNFQKCTVCGECFLGSHIDVVKMKEVWYNAHIPFLLRLCSQAHMNVLDKL